MIKKLISNRSLGLLIIGIYAVVGIVVSTTMPSRSLTVITLAAYLVGAGWLIKVYSDEAGALKEPPISRDNTLDSIDVDTKMLGYNPSLVLIDEIDDEFIEFVDILMKKNDK